MSVENELKEIKDDLREHQLNDKEFFQIFSDDLKDFKGDLKEIKEAIMPVLNTFNGLQYGGKAGKIILWTIGAILGIVATILGIIAAVKSLWN